jgi:hypothetical protein
MAFDVSFAPIPHDYPSVLADPQPRRVVVAAAPWLLAGLVLLCLVPRALVACKIRSVCPDGVLYIQLAEALDKGDLQSGLREMRLNTLPLILLGLHRMGLDWELAGKIWGVAISSLTVLPLFGLARRQFDDRVAAVACLLYAFHVKLIEWSPEMIRDPTFWFLFMLSLYLLWRAVTEVRLRWFACGGLAVVLAFLTRVEGLFLLIPLLLWSGWRLAALGRGRWRLALGVALAVLIFPALFVLINVTWLYRHPHWEFSRLRPFEIAQCWLETPAGRAPKIVDPNLSILDPQVRMSGKELTWTFLHTAEQGLGPIFALLMFGGVWIRRRVWLRCDHQALCCMALAIAAAMWVHLWYAQSSSNRYVLPLVLLGTVFAAQAVLSLSWWIGRLLGRLGTGASGPGWVAAGLLLVLGGAGCSQALASNYDYRLIEPQLGRWIQQRFGPSPTLIGPYGVTSVISYYARGDCRVLPLNSEDPVILDLAAEYHPDVVLLLVTHHMRRMNPDRYQSLLGKLQELGFSAVEPAELPEGCQRLLVLTRRGAERVAHRGAAADSATVLGRQ